MILPLRILANFGRSVLQLFSSSAVFFRQITYMSDLIWKTFVRAPKLFLNINLTIQQMYILGIESISLVAVTSIFVGGETVVQAMYQFSGMLPLRYLGMAVSKTLVSELCPVLTALVVSSRVTTSIAAEIASMKSSEQLDAMQCLNLDSIRYLIVPKVVSIIVMMPVLVIFSELVAYTASIFTAVLFTDVTLYTYLVGLRLFFSPLDLFVGIAKTSVFGAIIALVGAHFGYQAFKGADGVGEATTKAVTVGMILILVFDFLIAFLIL